MKSQRIIRSALEATWRAMKEEEEEAARTSADDDSDDETWAHILVYDRIAEVLCWILDEPFPAESHLGSLLGQSSGEPDKGA